MKKLHIMIHYPGTLRNYSVSQIENKNCTLFSITLKQKINSNLSNIVNNNWHAFISKRVLLKNKQKKPRKIIVFQTSNDLIRFFQIKYQ